MASRRVLITGASRGIGYSTAQRLAGTGHRPVGLARSAPPDFPGDFYAVDLADRAATYAILEEVVASGPVDAVVNNVALVQPAAIGDVDLDDLAQVFDMNVRVAVQVTQAVLPGMIAQGWGRIVNITSMVTVGGAANRTAYGAAKAALDFCSRAWASELAARGITVNSVAPGPTETELFGQLHPQGPAREAILSRIPVGRFGRPSELSAAIAFLLSDEAGYITGQTLRVDGGGSIGTSGAV